MARHPSRSVCACSKCAAEYAVSTQCHTHNPIRALLDSHGNNSKTHLSWCVNVLGNANCVPMDLAWSRKTLSGCYLGGPRPDGPNRVLRGTLSGRSVEGCIAAHVPHPRAPCSRAARVLRFDREISNSRRDAETAGIAKFKPGEGRGFCHPVRSGVILDPGWKGLQTK